MTSIRRGTLTLPTSTSGPSTPLPDIFGGGDLHAPTGFDDAGDIDGDDIEGDGVDDRLSRAQTALPYLDQDGYRPPLIHGQAGPH